MNRYETDFYSSDIPAIREALKGSAEEAYNENAKQLGEAKQNSYIPV